MVTQDVRFNLLLPNNTESLGNSFGKNNLAHFLMLKLVSEDERDGLNYIS